VKRRAGWILATAAALALLGFCAPRASVQTGTGVLAPDEPVQRMIDRGEAWTRDCHRFTPRAHFTVQARVLGREDYRFDRGARVAPMDLALGWGRMSDGAVLERIDISQGARWWHWRSSAMPIPAQEVQRSAANMHLIPATEAVADRLDQVRVGQVVTLRGKLVDVRGDDGFRWSTSLSRTDSGDGACELVWVESVELR
jgi:hypothetical protein